MRGPEGVRFVPAFLAALAVELSVAGVAHLAAHARWVVPAVLVGVVVWLRSRHPGVRAAREVRAAIRRGRRQRARIARATRRTGAEMDRLARARERRW